jgi:uncharacterized repeat protein (TIGR01451 family)
MSPRGLIRSAAGGTARLALLCGVAAWAGSGPASAQGPPVTMSVPPGSPTIAPAGIPVGPVPPGYSTFAPPGAEGAPAAGAPVLSPNIQVVRFQVPEGVRVEVLGPPPEPIPVAPTEGAPTFGMKVGVGYQLHVTNLPERPGAELYPVIEVVGHLHRPAGIDPGRFPIRVVLSEFDFEEVVDRSRLVTEVVYLEDPDQAIPLSLPKDEIPIANLNPSEDPLRVGAALGRAMVILRIGNRIPNPEEWAQSVGMGLASAPCPFTAVSGGPCQVPCGPVRGTAPPPGRPWVPKDEFLCDGGDHAEPVHFGGDGGLRGIDPRDAVIKFSADYRPRVLPTNLVCIYAPRFAAVRTVVGANEALKVDVLRGAELIEGQMTYLARQESRRLVQNQTAEANRHRARASGMVSRILPAQYIELRILHQADTVTHIAGFVRTQAPIEAISRQKAGGLRGAIRPIAIKTAEAAVVTGIIESANQTIMAWKPEEVAGVELPPRKPGLAVIKRTSASVAEPGDVVTFSIQYRNMGNSPITSVSVVDSLLPRLEYVKGSAQGPEGSVFTAGENNVGSTELRWDLPGTLEAGAEGFVSFQAKVR